jgi:DNA-binding transcriptional LysR family regulator
VHCLVFVESPYASSRNIGGLSYRQLCALLTIAETGSILRATIQLSMSQPALSRGLNQIETKLGVHLFEPSISGVQLTTTARRAMTEDL